MREDHSGVFMRAFCEKCGAFPNVELPVNVALAWQDAAESRRLVSPLKSAAEAWRLVHDELDRLVPGWDDVRQERSQAENAVAALRELREAVVKLSGASLLFRREAVPCAHKHVLTMMTGAECRDCHAPLRFNVAAGLYQGTDE